jgi:hypothetical protein
VAGALAGFLHHFAQPHAVIQEALDLGFRAMKPKAVPSSAVGLGAIVAALVIITQAIMACSTNDAFEAGLRTRSNRRAIRSARLRRSVQERWTGDAAARAKRAAPLIRGGVFLSGGR